MRVPRRRKPQRNQTSFIIRPAIPHPHVAVAARRRRKRMGSAENARASASHECQLADARAGTSGLGVSGGRLDIWLRFRPRLRTRSSGVTARASSQIMANG